MGTEVENGGRKVAGRGGRKVAGRGRSKVAGRVGAGPAPHPLTAPPRSQLAQEPPWMRHTGDVSEGRETETTKAHAEEGRAARICLVVEEEGV